MDIKVYMDFHLVPAKEALIRYKANPDEVANRGDSEEINLIFGDGFIYQDEGGAHDISIPTCERDALAEPTTALDREVYQKLVDEGVLKAAVSGVEISLYDCYSGNIPLVDFECEVTGYEGVIARTINPFEPKDTPKMPLFIWEAAAAKAREAANRFVELSKATQDSNNVEGQ